MPGDTKYDFIKMLLHGEVHTFNVKLPTFYRCRSECSSARSEKCWIGLPICEDVTQNRATLAITFFWRENRVFTYDPESKRFLPTVGGSSNLVQETINSLIISRMSVQHAGRLRESLAQTLQRLCGASDLRPELSVLGQY